MSTRSKVEIVDGATPSVTVTITKDGIGVPAGGTTGQFLAKATGTDYNTEWTTASGTGDLLAANNLSDVDSAATSRTNLGLVIGTDVQAYDAALDNVSGTNTGDEVAASTTVAGVAELATTAELDTGTDTTRAVTVTAIENSARSVKLDGIEALADVTDATTVAAAGGLLATNDLSDLTNDATARTNLDVDQAGTDNSTDVTLAGTPDYLTIDGSQVITRGLIDPTTDIDPLTAGAGEQLTVNEAGTALDYGLASKYLPVRKGSVGTIAIGTPVYLDGYNASGFIEVETADASNASLMPAVGVAFDALTNGANARVLMSGLMTGLDTSSYTAGDRLYVAAAVGAGVPWLTATKPTTGLIQAMATVTRSNVSNGTIVVHGASRSNDVPNGYVIGTDIAPAYVAPVVVSGTTDTLADADHGVTNRYTNAAAVTVTLPTDAADDLPDGFWTLLVAEGAGGLTLSTTGVTLAGSSPNTTIAQNEALMVQKTAVANTWNVIGGTAA